MVKKVAVVLVVLCSILCMGAGYAPISWDECNSKCPEGGDYCYSVCMQAYQDCFNCCHIKLPSATGEHCGLSCRKNVLQYLCEKRK